jgi:hypothetical protein
MSPNRTATGRKGYFLSDDSTIVSGRTEKVCLSSARCSSFKTTLKFPLDKTVGQHHFCWRNPVIFPSLVIMGDDVLDWGHERRSVMKLLTLALGAVLFALAAAPSANAWVRPEWVVVRWANADCKIWHNDTNAPAGYGWQTVAFAGTWGGAYWKMGRLYQMHVCV